MLQLQEDINHQFRVLTKRIKSGIQFLDDSIGGWPVGYISYIKHDNWNSFRKFKKELLKNEIIISLTDIEGFKVEKLNSLEINPFISSLESEFVVFVHNIKSAIQASNKAIVHINQNEDISSTKVIITSNNCSIHDKLLQHHSVHNFV